MPMYSKAAGVFHHAAKLFYKVAGVWKPVRQAWIKNNGIWKQSFADNVIEAYSFGLFETVYPLSNNGVWVNGRHIYSLGANWAGWNQLRINNGIGLGDTAPPANQTSVAISRSYNLATFDKYGNVNPTSYNFDIWNDGPGQTSLFQAAVDALPVGQIFVVVCNDAIQPNSDLLGPVINELGGTGATFTNGQVLSYSSYMLIGKKGSPAFFETFVGGDPVGSPSSPTAANALSAAYKKFTIHENTLIALS